MRNVEIILSPWHIKLRSSDSSAKCDASTFVSLSPCVRARTHAYAEGKNRRKIDKMWNCRAAFSGKVKGGGKDGKRSSPFVKYPYGMRMTEICLFWKPLEKKISCLNGEELPFLSSFPSLSPFLFPLSSLPSALSLFLPLWRASVMP